MNPCGECEYNDPPSLTVPNDDSIAAGSLYEGDALGTDDDGFGAISGYSITIDPDATFVPTIDSDGNISWQTHCDDAVDGVATNYLLTVTVTDVCEESVSDSFILTVNPCIPSCQLDSLTFYSSHGDNPEIEYTPTFSPIVYNYQDSLNNPQPQYYFIATSADLNIVIKYKFDRGSCGCGSGSGCVSVWTPVGNGDPSPDLNMCQNGLNTVKIRVSSDNCTSVIYTWVSERGN